MPVPPKSSEKVADKPKKAAAAAKKPASTATGAKAAKPKAAAKPAVKSAEKAVTKKPAAARKPAAKPASGTQPILAPEQRRYYVEVAAYYIAERRGFHGGSQLDDWVQAEIEIDRLLREGILKP